MDNEDKVKDLVLRSKNLFLKDIQKEIGRSELYNLDEEFAKTKKNRSPVVWISIILFVVVFVGIAVLVNAYIQRESRNIAVNIEAFEDVNLRDVLDKAKQYDRELTEARRRLQDLQNAMEGEIEQLRASMQRQIDVLNTRNMTAAARNRDIAELESKFKADAEAVREQYRPKIEEVEREIALIEGKMAAYDSKMVEMAREQEEVLNNQQRLFEIRHQETVDYYEAQIAELKKRMEEERESFEEYRENLVEALEANHQEEIQRLILKYNPRFTDEEVLKILDRKVDDFDQQIPFGFSEVLARENLYTKEELNTQYARIEDIRVLTERLMEIPYINSVPDALAHMENTMYLVVNEYEHLWHTLADDISAKVLSIRSRNRMIDQFTFALNSLIFSSRENGYILDSRNPDALVVFIGDLYDVNEGDTGYVFREDDEFIAHIRFTYKDGRLYAQTKELADPAKAIQPFDKILIETN